MSEPGEIQELTLETLGQRLAHMRRDAQMSVEDVAGNLKLTVRVINALESANDQQLPSPVFTKGYYIAYGRLFGLEKVEVECYFDNAFPSTDAITQKHIECLANKPSGERFDKEKANLKPLFITLFLIALAVAAFFAYETLHGVTPSVTTTSMKKPVVVQKKALNERIKVASAQQSGASKSTVVDETNELESSEQPAVDNQGAAAVSSLQPLATEETASSTVTELSAEPVATEQTDISAMAEEAVSVNAVEQLQATSDEAEVSIEVLPNTEEKLRVIGAGAHQLQIKFNAKCWVQVTNSNGELLVSNSYAEGWELQVNTDEELDIVLGYAHGVEVYYDQTPVKLRIRNSGSASLTL